MRYFLVLLSALALSCDDTGGLLIVECTSDGGPDSSPCDGGP